MRRLFPLLILVFSVSSLLIFLLGDSGLLSYHGLAAYREELAANVASLDARHEALTTRLSQLRDDAATATVLARDLGLYKPGEAVIRLEGRASRPEINAVGDLLRYHGPPDARNKAFKAAAVCISLLLLAGALLRGLSARRRANARTGR